jgi:hypothetical protein
MGTGPIKGGWPWFTETPLFGSWFWESFDRGELVNLAPAIAKTRDRVLWAQTPAGMDSACCAVTADVQTDGAVLPSGVYADWRALRDGAQVPALDTILAGDLDDLGPRLARMR